VSPFEIISVVAVIFVAITLGIMILNDVASAEERRSREEYLIAAARRQARRRPTRN
jgi:hypothetical protein